MVVARCCAAMLKFLDIWARRSKLEFGAALIALTILIGYVDYATGPRVAMSAFYLLPVAFAAWQIGLTFALVVAVMCVGVWFAGDFYYGDALFQHPAIVAWNSSVKLAEFVVMAIAVDRLRTVQRGLETRVRERTEALERSQNALLQNSEQEQRRIGQDLHDGLSQHLAGTAFVCQALHNDLAEKSLPEAETAQRVVDLLKEGIRLTRQTAKGLDPVQIGAEGLMEALEEFASTTSRLFDVSCRFECDYPVPVRDSTVAGNLFRIAQESVSNAIKHGRAKNIGIALVAGEEGVELIVQDDGMGIANSPKSGRGMGMTIMPRRAASIGASFEARSRQPAGTVVRCFLPADRIPGDRELEPAGA
jgi:signal transduction histidine kinase